MTTKTRCHPRLLLLKGLLLVFPVSAPAAQFELVLENGTVMDTGNGRDAVLDADTVREVATFAEPNCFSEGIRYVIVGVNVVVNDGRLQDDVFPGAPIISASRPKDSGLPK